MKNVSLFIPCIVDLFMPDTGEAAVNLLRKLGLSPIYHENQTCCGQPAFHAGHSDEAVKLAKRFIEIFEDDEIIVCPSGSCVVTVKKHYPEMLADDPKWQPRAESVSNRIFELSEFIVDHMGVTDVGARFNGKVAYHESCQLSRELGVVEQPKSLIRAVAGTELVPLPNASVCCGFGGKFSVDYADISEALVKEKAGHYIASKADLLVVSEPGCFLNINGYLTRHHPEHKAMHIADFLAGPADC
ncbi:MAG: (Fe-S)-binding protein [Desulfobacterales bacterium]